jgi:chromosome segregation ATPase
LGQIVTDQGVRLNGVEVVTANHTNRLAIHDQTLLAIDTTLNDQGVRLGNVETVTANHTTRLAQHDTVLANHGQALVDIGATLGDHEVRLDGVEAVTANHTTRLAQHDTVLANHEGRIDNVEAVTANHTTRLAQHDTVLVNHEERITTAQTTADTALNAAAVADGKASQAQSTANLARQEVAAVSNRVDALETRIGEVRRDSFRGTASAMAMSGSLPALVAGERAWFLRSGVYGGSPAVAAGLAAATQNGVVLDGKVSYDGKRAGLSVGVSGKF